MVEAVATEELLWPLNEVERKFAPTELFTAGDVSLLRTPCVAVVGSRTATPEGLARARRFAGLLVERNVTVVATMVADRTAASLLTQRITVVDDVVT